MTNKKVREKMKRALAALLTAGLVVTGMPGSVVEAANETIEQTLNEEETSGAENPGADGETSGEEEQEDKAENETPDDGGSEDDKSSEDGDGLDEQTPAGEEQTEDKEVGEDDAEEEESEEALVYRAQVSGNDLMTYGEKELPEVSLFFVNPLFEDILDADELKAETALLQEKAARDRTSLFSSRETTEVYTTAEEAADYMRGQMVDRENTVEFYVPVSLIASSMETLNEDFKAFTKDVIGRAIAYTPECTGQEGDALALGYKSWDAGAEFDGADNYLVTFTILYYTTHEQEIELTQEVDESLAELNLDTKTEYQKIRTIYDFICDNVDYDHTYTQYSAYDALCTGTAVCQGYSVLFYRICKDAGLSVRSITGMGYGGSDWERHAWNIVQFGEKYYNVDATWDGQDEETRHNYFMLNEKDFVNHIREETQNTDEFHATYPMALVSYIDESDFEEKFEKSNYAFNFTTTEDEVISSAAVGKPKLLIFFDPNDNGSGLTIQNIAEQGKEIGLTGVDIYAIGATQSVAGKETVENFKNTYGGDNITFAYDADRNNFSHLSDYVRATGNTSFSYPVICYIDEHNKFQYLTMGKSNASVVKANLTHYCDAVFESEETPDPDHSLTGASVSLTENDFTYNGTEQKPKVTVTIDGNELKEETDYTLSYKDNINAGTATVTVTGKGAYTGTATADFEIKKAPLTLKAKDIAMQVGDAFPPEYGYEITAGSLMAGDNLRTSVSYTCTATNSETAGTYEIEILNAKVGDGAEDNYEIKCEKGTLIISDRPAISLEDANISLTASDFTYNKKPHTPEVTVMLSGTALAAGTDYEVTYTDNTNAGTATVTVTGKGAYTGTATTTFEIKKAPLTLKAKDITMQVGGAFPPEYGYEITAGSLMAGDSLKMPVSYTCTAKDSETAGTYEIEILEVKVGDDDEDNYEINYVVGTLTILDKPVVSLEGADISLTTSDFTYNGKSHTPAVTVTLSGTALTAGTDYEVSYTDNINAGKATVTVTGKGAYTGTATMTFEINKATLTIRAKDVRIRVDEAFPEKYECEVSGLVNGETLEKEPLATCEITSSASAGEYRDAIRLKIVDAGSNYTIIYINGTLKIVDEYIYYTVTFDVQGHGTDPVGLTSVREGTKIDKPAEDPTAEGYRFTGWYKDAGCKTAWDFENDVVEENLILYAGWEKEPVALQEENVSLAGTDLTYNKTAQKPTVVVMVSGEKLTEGTDYTLTCENNINAGTATATVTGMGNYTGTVSKDFTIKKAPINIWAKDKTILVGDPIPASYEYGMDDLFAGDTLLQEPTLSCNIEDTDVEEEYAIEISGADAGSNYEITLVNGTLRVVAEYTFYTVAFDVQGHGKAPAGYDKVQIGDTITKPVDPTENGYRFGGWYQDAACTIAWNFDRDTVQADLILYAKWVRESKEFQEEDVALEAEEFVYDGTAHRPKVVITVDGVTLVEGKDYRLSYRDNIDVGIAAVHVFGLNDYIGSKITKYFRIAGLSLVVRAKNKVILIGDPIPTNQDYEYEVIGLAEGDKLTKEPSFACSIKSSEAAGQYDIVPYGAEANNYSITYEAGILTVADEYVAYTVSFDMQGHGSTVNYIGVKAGSTIDRPTNPTAEGYRFDGWYRDKACTKVWDFENDIVQTDIVLYAKWLRLAEAATEDGFAIQEIGDMYYTGKPCKPAVSVYDGETLLKAGRDYQIKYYNHTNANKDGVLKQGNGTGTDFNPALPYVEIVGKGNYTETVRVNYNILRASIGDGGINPAAGVTLKTKDQLVTASNKSQKPFTSIKYVKAMKLNVDYTLSLRAVNVKDGSGNSVTGELDGAAVPAGYSGEFLLTVAGQGNYDGSVCKTVYVADKAHLLKNAAVTLGKNQKNVTFSNKAVELTAAETDSADTFTVKCGRVVLKPGQDYTVSYQDNDRVGKAKLIITGTGAYAGSKTVSFTIKGAAFSAKTVSVSGIEDKAYAGGAWTQNNVVLTYTATGQRLTYGMEYTISYSRNINKGTATMTFKGIEKAGYSGSFKKTFKIMAADINRVSWAEGMENLSFVYSKAGVKPVDEIILTDQDGYRLKNSRDYTLRYVNNKAVADKNSVKPPMVIVKGKGNYMGEIRVPFQIVKADLSDLTVKTTPVACKSGKGADYAYQPAVKLMDGKSVLRAGRDYGIEYHNNTQAAYDAYMNSESSTTDTDAPIAYGGVPVAVITARADSAYTLSSDGELVVPLPIYQKKLNKAEFWVEPEQALYTGGQVRPAVKVHYGNELLTEGEDYTLSYGKNIKSGKNQGSVTISGVAPKFGGSITVKFDIVRKPISY